MSTTVPSPGGTRPANARSVTAPELAQALENVPTQHQDRSLRSIRSREEDRRWSGNSADDQLNDLATIQPPTHRHEVHVQYQPPSSGNSSGFSPELKAQLPGSQSGWLLRYPLSAFRLPTARAWQTYFMQEVAGDKYLESQLLLMTIVTGVLDAMTYTTYTVFASKQTGNTLFLALHGLRVQALPAGVEENVAVSMGVFVCGAIFFGHIGHISRQRRRIWLLASNTFQAFLVLAAAALRYWCSRERTGPGALGILACLAFAESGQIANALNTNMPELNTTMITGALIQLCTDPRIFHLHNTKRNRRLAFLSSMFIGCFIGAAVLARSSPSAVLVVAAGLKGALVLSLFFNRGMVDKTVSLEAGEKKVEGCVTPASRVLWGD